MWDNETDYYPYITERGREKGLRIYNLPTLFEIYMISCTRI